MPELPEVETTIRYLRTEMLDKLIKRVIIYPKGERHFNFDIAKVTDYLNNSRLKNLDRVGKWMLFDFGNIKAVGHLRMSGRFLVNNNPQLTSHHRFSLELETGKLAHYIDQRRFGTFHLMEDFTQYESLRRLGPDALSPEFNAEYLLSKLKTVKKPIYSALLDQSIIAGLGNIYVNETLHASKIHPLQPANTVPKAKLEEIVTNSKQKLTMALKFKGTTLIDNLYQDPEGKTGEFAKMLQVYGKKKDPDIQVLKIGGRSVFVHNSLRNPIRKVIA